MKETTGNMIFRRWWEKEKRFVYFDLISYRNYYESPVGGKVIVQRSDEIDRQLGPFQQWTGKYDKNGEFIFVLDFVTWPYGRDLIVWDDKTSSIQAIEEGITNIYYGLRDATFDESIIDGHIFLDQGLLKQGELNGIRKTCLGCEENTNFGTDPQCK